jgi:uncharacterized protein (TIGR03437 family)
MSFRGVLAALILFLAASGAASAQNCNTVTLNNTGAFANATASNGTFTITGNPANCFKSASSNASWITISFGGGTANPSTIGYSVQANPSPNQRVGTITVNGGLATFSVTQSGFSCSYSVTPATATVSADGATNTASVSTTAECPWSASVDVPWISASGTGQGNGSFSYSVQPNTAKESRTGTITVGNDTLVVTQQPACSFTLAPPFQQIRSSAETGSITVTANVSSCVRNAISDSPWLTIPVGSTGTGNGTISWSAAANTTPTTRSAKITVGDATFSLQQEGGSCSYSISPSAQNIPAIGSSGSFALTTTCQWTATSSSPWLSVVGNSSGTGSATISFRADANPSPVIRTGSISVGGTAFQVTQEATACNLNISSSALEVPSSGGTGSFEVDVISGCSWTAVSSVPWITFTSTASGGGDATLSFSVAPNTTPGLRTGTITVGNRVFTVSQPGANCELSISPTSNTAVPSNAFSSSIAVNTTCQWTAQSTVPWVTLTAATSGTGNGQVDYSIPANPSAQSRSGSIRIGNLTFNIIQTGGGCTITLNPARGTFSGAPVTGRFNVNGSLGCQWTPTASDPWITVSGFSSINGSGAVDFTLTPNFSGAERTGSIRLTADTTYSLTQALAKPTIVSGGILNAASFRPGPVAPGEIVTIYGTLMGPADIKTLELTPDRTGITDSLASTRVLFDGQPSPLIYTTEKQLSAIVPYETSGKTSTKVKVEYMGSQSDETEIAVAPTAPAIFTQNASGTGPGAILNQDNSLNTATNAAQRNSVIQIFATGGGQTNPPGQTGKLTGTPLPVFPAGRVTVRINNIDAPVVYSGAAPGLVQGLIQINARIPATAPIGAAVPIVVRINNVDSPAGVTVAVRQ